MQKTKPQRQEPSSCCTSSSLVWQRWQRLRLRCLDPLRGEDDEDDAAEKDDDEESSHCGTSLALARFSGEASLSDPEAESKERFVGVDSELKTSPVVVASS